jgi:hypothetical protein
MELDRIFMVVEDRQNNEHQRFLAQETRRHQLHELKRIKRERASERLEGARTQRAKAYKTRQAKLFNAMAEETQHQEQEGSLAFRRAWIKQNGQSSR